MANSFDVFLSHNSKDKPAVRKLAEALRARGLRVWLDEWELVPGRPWQEALEEIIETTGASAVLVGKDGLGPWQDAEMRGCLSEFVERKIPVIPVLLPGAPEVPRLPFFLTRFTWVDLRGGLSEEGIDRLQWGITGKRPVPLVRDDLHENAPQMGQTKHAPHGPLSVPVRRVFLASGVTAFFAIAMAAAFGWLQWTPPQTGRDARQDEQQKQELQAHELGREKQVVAKLMAAQQAMDERRYEDALLAVNAALALDPVNSEAQKIRVAARTAQARLQTPSPPEAKLLERLALPLECPSGWILQDSHCVKPNDAPSLTCPDESMPLNGRCGAAERKCQQATIFANEQPKTSGQRGVLFVHGDMVQLFDQYIDDAKATNILVETDELTIYYYEGGQGRQAMQAGVDVSMTLGQFFSGLTWNQLWKRKLKGKQAQDLPDPSKEANALGVDLACGTGGKRSKS